MSQDAYCSGCGSKIQSSDKTKPGYIKNLSMKNLLKNLYVNVVLELRITQKLFLMKYPINNF